MAWQEFLGAAVFAATFLMLAAGRWGKVAVPRGASALAGGVATALLFHVSPRVIDVQVLLLLAGLMALSSLLAEGGLFGRFAATLRGMSPRVALFAGAAGTAGASALFLNDAAVVVLLPVLLPVLVQIGVAPVPATVVLAMAANVGSLLTPFGNPQNAYLARAGDLSPVDFLMQQGPLFLVGMMLLAGACWRVPVGHGIEVGFFAFARTAVPWLLPVLALAVLRHWPG